MGAFYRGQETADLNKAQPFIDKVRSLLYSPDASLHPADRGAQIQQVRDKLHQLDLEHAQILQGCVSDLQNSLGPASFKKLDAYVQKEAARHDVLLSSRAPGKASAGNVAAPAGADQ